MSIKIALAGNPNCGKTTLFNALTLSPYTLEEVVARNYLINERPDVIINIVDGTNIERNLYLTTQLMELGIPVIMAVNMTDLLEKNGDRIHIEQLSGKLGCEVVGISALKGTGIMEAAEKAVALEEQKRFFAIKLLEKDDKISAQMEEVPDISSEIKTLEDEFDDDTESIITNERYEYISSIIGECCVKSNKKKLSTSDKIDRVVTNRWLALPIFAAVMILVYYISVTTVGTWVTDWTNDGFFGDGWHLFGIGSGEYDDDMTEYAIEHIWTNELKVTVNQAVEADVIGAEDIMGAIEDEDYEAFDEAVGFYGDSLAEEGYDISEYLEESLGTEDDPNPEVPDTADYGVWVPGIPVFAEKGLDAVNCADWLKGLILDGIVAGVGAVLGFVPQMLVLFIFLAFLEACGYMARVAFIMDRIFRKFGLSGKSFIPMLVGTGCGVPGVMASRTIENDRDRKMTIMTTTFIPCGAKLPIIALITAALFGGAWWVAPSAYFVGIAAIVFSGIILNKDVCRRPCSVCNGTSGISSADGWECIAFYVGTRMVLY